MPADPRITTHASAAVLAESLAAQIQAELQQAITARGKALLVISGGSTPRRLLETLSQASLDWPITDYRQRGDSYASSYAYSSLQSGKRQRSVVG